MTDFVPPSGPPPPQVPEGWKAVWNDQYKEWFYVNLKTKASQWDKPTAPATGPEDAPPADAPPGYNAGGNAPHVSDAKNANLYNSNTATSPIGGETDEQMARRLQQQESANRGTAGGYYGQQGGQGQQGYPQSPSYDNNQLPPRPDERGGGGSRGLFSKLLGKTNRPQQGYGGGQYGGPPQGYPQQGGYGPQYGGGPAGYQPQYGGGYGGGYGQPYGGGYGRPGMMGGGMMGGGAPPRKGMGAGGAAALGVGGGLVGGMLLADAMNDGQQDAYQDGYQDGADDGGGGDFDGGGGDF